MAPHITDQMDTSSSDVPLASRLSLDPALGRRRAVDGGWWPGSRDAGAELPGLISSLNARVGSILRLSVDARDWDDIPRRITVGGHVVRVGRFATMNHKIILTRGAQDHIMLLVVPPRASTASAKAALAMAADGRNSGLPEEILATSGADTEAGGNAPRTGDADRRSPTTEDGLPGELGRWLDDGAPSPGVPAVEPG
jgi:hypothetical protein